MEYKLDMKDKKLLYELDLNSRQSFNQIAKKLKLSKTAVIYRINNLQKEGIIKQFHTVIDTGKLGLISFRLFMSLQNASPEKEQEIIDFLNKREIVTWIVSIEGEYDLGVVVLTKSVEEMNNLWKELLDKYANYIDKRLLTIMTGVSYYSRAYLLDLKKNDYEIETFTVPKEEKIDEKDLAILRLLSSNARIAIIEISSKLKLSPKTVIDRIRNLEEKKIIIGYKTMFDMEKLGYQYFKIHLSLNNVNPVKKKEFKDYVKLQPHIIYGDEVLGGDDIEIEIQIKDMASLRKLIGEMMSRFSSIIKDYKILEYYQEHKYLFFPAKI